MTCDVLIAGSGPAGSLLGYLLATAGHRVLVIDKAAFPRDKVCGGGISNKTIELLPFDISPVVHRRVKGAFLTYQNDATIIKDLADRGGAVVVRSEFDEFLLGKAREAGVAFSGDTAFLDAQWTGDQVKVTTTRGAFTARYLVGADGVFSQVRARVFGKGLVSYVPAVEALVYLPPDKVARFGDRVLFDFGGMPRGYGWIFPKKDHLNVGVFSIHRTRSIQADLRRFMSWYRVLDDPSAIKYAGFSVPVKNARREYQRDNILLVGDAAGFAESFYGEGIYFALKSAVIAAQALAASFDRPQDKVYTRLVRKALHADLAYSALNARMVYRFQKIAFNRMVRNRHVNYYFSELVAGRVGHRECFYKTILTSPYWLFSRQLEADCGERF